MRKREGEKDIPHILAAESVTVLEAMVTVRFLTTHKSYHWPINRSLLETSEINLIELQLFFTSFLPLTISPCISKFLSMRPVLKDFSCRFTLLIGKQQRQSQTFDLKGYHILKDVTGYRNHGVKNFPPLHRKKC